MRRPFLILTAILLSAPTALAQKEFGFDNRKPSGQPYWKPEETVARFKVAPEFEVKLFAGEPQVVNPIAFTIDEKGRIWVVESFEYPKRTPKEKAPRDRIVILEDTTGSVWRYHATQKKFEVFAEGTSNPWGMDWRNSDGQFILCCCVIPHLFHVVPGGIYKRQAGASFNPYAYSYLNEICDHTFHKESGWAHAGLI